MAKFFEGHYYAFREGGKDEFLDFSRYSIILTDASRRGHIRVAEIVEKGFKVLEKDDHGHVITIEAGDVVYSAEDIVYYWSTMIMHNERKYFKRISKEAYEAMNKKEDAMPTYFEKGKCYSFTPEGLQEFKRFWGEHDPEHKEAMKLVDFVEYGFLVEEELHGSATMITAKGETVKADRFCDQWNCLFDGSEFEYFAEITRVEYVRMQERGQRFKVGERYKPNPHNLPHWFNTETVSSHVIEIVQKLEHGFKVTKVDSFGSVDAVEVDGVEYTPKSFGLCWYHLISNDERYNFVELPTEPEEALEDHVHLSELVKLFGDLPDGVGVAVMGEGAVIRNLKDFKKFLIDMLPKLDDNLDQDIQNRKDIVKETEKEIEEIRAIRQKVKAVKKKVSA